MDVPPPGQITPRVGKEQLNWEADFVCENPKWQGRRRDSRDNLIRESLNKLLNFNFLFWPEKFAYLRVLGGWQNEGIVNPCLNWF